MPPDRTRFDNVRALPPRGHRTSPRAMHMHTRARAMHMHTRARAHAREHRRACVSMCAAGGNGAVAVAVAVAPARTCFM